MTRKEMLERMRALHAQAKVLLEKVDDSEAIQQAEGLFKEAEDLKSKIVRTDDLLTKARGSLGDIEGLEQGPPPASATFPSFNEFLQACWKAMNVRNRMAIINALPNNA